MTKNKLIELFVELNKNTKLGNAKFKYGVLKNFSILMDFEIVK